jgi:hypothetical protein
MLGVSIGKAYMDSREDADKADGLADLHVNAAVVPIAKAILAGVNPVAVENTALRALTPDSDRDHL